MAGWGPHAQFAISPSERTEGEDRTQLLHVFRQAAVMWANTIGRPIFSIKDAAVDCSQQSATNAFYTIVVDFGEWNVKNGYTSPAVKPNRYCTSWIIEILSGQINKFSRCQVII